MSEGFLGMHFSLMFVLISGIAYYLFVLGYLCLCPFYGELVYLVVLVDVVRCLRRFRANYLLLRHRSSRFAFLDLLVSDSYHP